MNMLAFCGQDKCSVDANGRLKLSPRFLSDFGSKEATDIVLHCLPEGAIAVYPEDVYLEMRSAESKPAAKVGSSLVFRRSLRRFGSMSQPQVISKQGRLTLPPAYRDYADLHAGTDTVVVGVEIGVEIWNAKRWAAELDIINGHVSEKGEIEMADDLSTSLLDNN